MSVHHRLSITAIFLVLFSGCAARVYDISAVSYVSENFHPSHMKTEGLALLPVVAGQGKEGYRRPLGDLLDKHIAEQMGTGCFLGWRETMKLINEHGLADSYDEVISTYRQTAILQRDLVSAVASSLGVGYLLYVSLEEFHKQKTTEYSVWTGMQTTRTAGVTAFCQIWDAHSGDVAWEGKAGSHSQGGELTYEQPYEHYADIAASGLIRKLFRIESEAKMKRY